MRPADLGLALRRFEDLAELQSHHDRWAETVATSATTVGWEPGAATLTRLSCSADVRARRHQDGALSSVRATERVDAVLLDAGGGARAAGIGPVHLDPYRWCPNTGHAYVSSLSELARELIPTTAPSLHPVRLVLDDDRDP